MFTSPEPPKNPINIEGKNPQILLYSLETLLQKKNAGMDASKHNEISLSNKNYTGLHPEGNRNLSELVQVHCI